MQKCICFSPIFLILNKFDYAQNHSNWWRVFSADSRNRASLQTNFFFLHYLLRLIVYLKVCHIVSISLDRTSAVGRLGALMMCLRRARSLGLLKANETGKQKEEMLLGIVEINTVKQALSCKDNQVCIQTAP